MSRGDVILRLVELTKIYDGKQKVTALNNITTSFKRGEFVAVVGRSGSGKSTLINILGGLDQPSNGDYYCEGNNVSRLNEGHWDALRNKKIGFIFQNYFLIEYLTVYQNVEVALQFQNVPASMKDAKIREMVEKVGLKDHINKYPSQLSGGQRQRIAIARALVKEPDIILADEPTGALDWKTADEVIKLLRGESEDRLVVMVTHDRSIANKYANRIIEIENGDFKQDLVKEEIEQTYQNVFRKIKAVSLKKVDKFVMTFNKIKSNFFRNFFLALSLALAFSFSIIFNGLDRGVRDAYFNYYETLDQTDSNGFSVINTKDNMRLSDYHMLNNRIAEDLMKDKSKYDVVLGYSKDRVGYNNRVYEVEEIKESPDLLSETKVRLIKPDSKYTHDKLFVNQSKSPIHPNTLMVSSKFIRDYYNLDANDGISDYIGTKLPIPVYNLYKDTKLENISSFLSNSYEKENGEIGMGIRPSSNVEKTYDIRFLEIKVPSYCYDKESLNDYQVGVCESYFEKQQTGIVFNTYEDYLNYMDLFKSQINNETYFELLKRSNAIYYLHDINNPNYIKKVYDYVYMNLVETNSLTETYFYDTSTTIDFTITAIVDNNNESLLYMTDQNYNNLFKTQENNIEFLNSSYTINYVNGNKANVFDKLQRNSYKYEDMALINHDIVESDTSCSQTAITGYKTDQVGIAQSVFILNDYEACGKENVTSSYLNMINILFSSFFNILMIASVIFYSMLIKVIFKARINEIGVFRSVGSTIIDIKRLFFYEVLYIFFTASIMTFVILYFLINGINNMFLNLTTLSSRVVNISNIQLLISENRSIFNISYVNLVVQIVLVTGLILYISNKSISKVVNTNPIDILREVV